MPEEIRLNIPGWALPGFRERFGPELPEAAKAMSGAAPLDLRVNLLKGTREAAITALAAEGITAQPTTLSPWGLRLAERQPILATRAFREGLVEIQDEGSQLVEALVGATADMRVVDWCAGAGGKTMALAMLMRNSGHLVACEV